MSRDSYIHAALPGSPGGPLLLLFHGTGGDEHQFTGLGSQLVPGAAIISPRGDVSEFGAARFFRRTGEGVYDMDDLARATGKMAGFIKAQVEVAKPSSVLGLGYLLPVIYLLWSLKKGAVAGPNPWGASGLEWEMPSPPPTENFPVTPIVTSEPYEFTPHVAREAELV